MNRLGISEYTKVGMWTVKRDRLESNHPESTYQQILSQGKKPEDYGYNKTETHLIELEMSRIVIG